MRTLPLLLASALLAAAAPLAAQNRTDSSSVARRDATNTLPLVTSRTARFTTDQGTWMSVDVSPDGSTMVFDLLGDIYTVPMAGGKATRIIGGNSVDTQPRFSPDGRSLVFISDRNGSDATWPADADGRRARLLTNGGVYPVWTPDGRQIVTGRRARPHSPPDTPSSTRRKWRFDFLSPTTDHSCRPRQLDDFQAGGFLAR